MLRAVHSWQRRTVVIGGFIITSLLSLLRRSGPSLARVSALHGIVVDPFEALSGSSRASGEQVDWCGEMQH